MVRYKVLWSSIHLPKRALGIRGPVSISIAKSIEPIEITTMQITKSISGMEPAAGKTRSADTMGTKHFVDHGVYVVNGSINSYFAEKTGFDQGDVETIKECIKTLFLNDVSSARPDGSMEVKDIFGSITHQRLAMCQVERLRTY